MLNCLLEDLSPATLIGGQRPPLPSNSWPGPLSIRRAAVRALTQELMTYPKPGLVSPIDNGSHADMDATTFVRSTLALRHYFAKVAHAGEAGCDFARLRALGVDAEMRMLIATRGVNTHRGAIFHLGLLAAAAGRCAQAGRSQRAEPLRLGDVVAALWGSSIAAHAGVGASHGRQASARFGSGGARAEAAAGFPSVYGVGLPAYREVLRAGGSANQARVQALFALTAHLDDTNLLHRGGLVGLRLAQAQARGFLDRGGVAAVDWQQQAVRIHDRFVGRRLSPGGSADLLAACLFVDAMER